MSTGYGMKNDTEYMVVCEALAEAAAKKGNPAVGSIIALNGEIMGQGEEATKSKGDITGHAEMEAIRAAVAKMGKDLSQCVLYSTHEPCVMCGYAIRYHGIRKVVIHSPSEFLGSVSSECAVLTTVKVPPHWAAPPEIEWFSKTER